MPDFSDTNGYSTDATEDRHKTHPQANSTQETGLSEAIDLDLVNDQVDNQINDQVNNQTNDQVNNQANDRVNDRPNQRVDLPTKGFNDYDSADSPPPLEGIDATYWSHSIQELLDVLPRLWTRGLLYFLMGFTAITLPWASFSKVDETGTARGRLEPKGNSVELDAPVPGTVTAMRVKEGQTVKKGQILMEMESEVSRTDLEQAQSRLEGLTNRLSQFLLMQKQLEVSTSTQYLQNQAQATAQQAQIRQTQQQMAFNRSASQLSGELLTKDQDRVERFRSLREQGILSGIQVEDAERSLIETQERLEKYQSDIEQSQSELRKQQSTYDRTLREGELTILTSRKQMQELQAQITDVQAQIKQTEKQIQSLQFQLQQRILRSPMDGIIFELPIKEAGAVVQPGTLIAQIAPRNTTLVLRAEMPSSESGFLRVGMPVKLKFDAYPFQEYGIIEGYLYWISPDSKVKQTNQGEIEMFQLEVTIDQSSLRSSTRQVALTPGQTATAEVIVRQRRIIDFVLDPFRQLQAGGLKL